MPEVVTIDTVYGPMRILAEETAQTSWLRYSGASAEDEMIGVVRDLLAEREPGVFVDVGASYGCWGMALRDVVSKVVAIEPQRDVGAVLCQNMRSDVDEVYVGCACWSGDVRLDLTVPRDGNRGGASAHVARHGRVVGTRLDDLVDDSERISLIKVDVEGNEREVLLGAQGIIRRWRPLMFVEYGHPGSSEVGLRQQIDSLSYHVEPYPPNFLCVPL